ncbi:peptide ABC transporter substrate-binding protein [Oceanivirga salmonicida]|uniref:peptide ABC transporter substrate-binding protein n=1 Tax=Oceanivirga salmonicida TaxID=1769291 RepID=UPI00082C5D9C|nr:peptide ABC transporter substrate-binding protein [Oceanivirga salmonicida]
MKKIITSLLLAFAVFSCGGTKEKANEKVAYFNAVAEGRSFDPQILTDGFTMNIHGFLTEGLTDTLPDGTVIPRQAKSWEISEDGLTWTFHLRDDIKWSDGSNVVADDFINGWERALSPEIASEYAFILFPIKNAEKYTKGEVTLEEVGFKAIDDKTIEVKLEYVTPYFDSLVSFITYSPAKRDFVKEKGADYALELDALLYNGPFVLTTWEHNNKLIVERNDNYYDKENVKLDKVIIKYIKDESSSLNAFKNGELDFTKLSSEEATKYLEDSRLKKLNLARTAYIAYNTTNEAFKNENIRRAFSLSINKEGLVKSVFRDLKVVSNTLTPANTGIKGVKEDFVKEVGKAFDSYNPEKAKEYLAKGLKELGLEKLPKLTLLIDDRYSDNRKIGATIQEDIRKSIGVDVEVEMITFKERLARTKALNHDFVLNSWGADYQDPMTFLDLMASFNGNNVTGFKDENYDGLIKKATETPDRAKRIGYLIEAEKYLADKMPILPLYQELELFLFNENLTGVELSPFGVRIRLNNADKVIK